MKGPGSLTLVPSLGGIYHAISPCADSRDRCPIGHRSTVDPPPSCLHDLTATDSSIGARTNEHMSKELEVTDGDDIACAASMLLRVMARDGSQSAALSVLRVLELNEGVWAEMPKWGSSDLKWSFGIGSFKFDMQSTSKLLEAASQRLKGLEATLSWPRAFPQPAPAANSLTVGRRDASGPRYWSAPLTRDVLCASRYWPTGSDKAFAGRPLEDIAKP